MTETLGILAGLLTTGSFLPQVYQTIKTRDVAGISLLMYLAFTTGVLLWLVYGLLNSQIAVILANGITFVLAAIILSMKIRYRHR